MKITKLVTEKEREVFREFSSLNKARVETPECENKQHKSYVFQRSQLLPKYYSKIKFLKDLSSL